LAPAAPIAILSALAEEQQGLREQLEGPRSILHAGREFCVGSLYGHPVVLALSRIGKVAAATTAAALIEHLGVQKIIFTGVAGGIGAGVRVGDVVVADSFVQHDMDASPLFPRYEVPLTGTTVWPADAGLSATVLSAAESALRGIGYDGAEVRLHQGLIASGDRFVSGAQEVGSLVSALQAAGIRPLAVEMEGAAVAQVCADYATPFAAIRTISDRADDTAHVDFPRFVREVAGVYACKVILKWFELLPKA
jgi:adenosylhomocysteine nucleosidase